MIVPEFMNEDLTIYIGDVIETLKEFKDDSIDCVVTSPPYWGLRDYGHTGQIGSEETPELFVESLVEVFSHVHRVLTKTGTVWLNLGDTYKNKELVGVPWMVALAMKKAGWILRSDVIWAKNNPMPEAVRDRPTRAHEYVFLFSKRKKYWWDQFIASEPAKWERWGGQTTKKIDPMSRASVMVSNRSKKEIEESFDTTRKNMRSVWSFPTQNYKNAHFATFPEELPKRAIEASCPLEVCIICGEPRKRIVDRSKSDYRKILEEQDITWREMHDAALTEGKGQDTNRLHIGQTRDANGKAFKYKSPTMHHKGWTKCKCAFPAYRKGIALDPFAGSGTTMKVARDLGRHGIGIDLQPDYLPLMLERNNICR